MIMFEWLNHCMRDFTALIPLNKHQNGENTSKYVVTVFFLKSAPGAFEIEIQLCFFTLQIVPPLYCK